MTTNRSARNSSGAAAAGCVLAIRPLHVYLVVFCRSASLSLIEAGHPIASTAHRQSTFCGKSRHIHVGCTRSCCVYPHFKFSLELRWPTLAVAGDEFTTSMIGAYYRGVIQLRTKQAMPKPGGGQQTCRPWMHGEQWKRSGTQMPSPPSFAVHRNPGQQVRSIP